MEIMQKMRIHPLAAGAALALTIASAVAVAAPPGPGDAGYGAAPPSYGAQAAPACRNCGVVQSVNAYQIRPRKSVAGMVGGGVVGALVGSQFGHGSTNTLATVGGAAGGAYVGNKIGQKVEAKTRYRVVVRMDDGRIKTFSYAARPGFSAGSYVRVENGTLVRVG